MISVAMATYNGEKYIRKQLESILNQTKMVDEIIICDDCSSDNTCVIINEIIRTHLEGNRIRLICNERNLGYIENFRKSISLAKGEYIFLSDQDDIWHPEKVELLLDKMIDNDASCICTNSSFIDQNDKKIEDKEAYCLNSIVRNTKEGDCRRLSFHRLLYGNVSQGCTYCITADVGKKYVKLESNTVPHDYQLILISAIEGKAYFWNKELVNYRLHSENAIGFTKRFHREKKIHLKPKMVIFLNELKKVIKIRRIWYYKILFFLRIPAIYYRLTNIR